MHFQTGISDQTAQRVLAYAASAHTRNRSFWGDPGGGVHRIDIYLCRSHSRYQQLSFWTSGNACSAGSSILLYPSGVGYLNLAPVLCHEMSHAYLRQHMGWFSWLKVPRWLDEGVATVLGESTWASQAALGSYLRGMSPPQLVSVRFLNSRLEWGNGFYGSSSVAMQYAQARSVADYVIQHYGVDTLRQYLSRLSFFKNPEQVFAATYPAGLSAVEETWLRENIASGHIPQGTTLVRSPLSPVAIAQFYAPYLFLFLCLLWFVRQCCRLARFLWALLVSLLAPPRHL